MIPMSRYHSIHEKYTLTKLIPHVTDADLSRLDYHLEFEGRELT